MMQVGELTYKYVLCDGKWCLNDISAVLVVVHVLKYVFAVYKTIS